MHSLEVWRRFINYNPITGAFTYIASNHPRQVIGKRCDYVATSKYKVVSLNNVKVLAHRLAWLLSFGYWPDKFVDHINGDRQDNRLDNLREADQQLNQENRKKARSRSFSNLLGVSRSRDKFTASITHQRKRYYLGSYDTPEAAHAAYVDAKRKLHSGGTL